MRFCVDCQFCEQANAPPSPYTCGAVRDIVTGEVRHMPCHEARYDPQCGPSAVLFKEADGVGEKRIARERETRKPEAPEAKQARQIVERVRKAPDTKPGKSD